MGKMLGGEEEKDPDAAKKEEERQEMLRQQEEERKAKHARMEAEREKVRQTIRDKVRNPPPPPRPCRRSITSVSSAPPVWTEEEGGEGGGGEGSDGAGLRGLADAPQKGHPPRLRGRGGGRGEHPGHRPQVPAGTHSGHLQEVKEPGWKDRGTWAGSSLAWAGSAGRRKAAILGGGVLAKLLEAAHCLSTPLI